MQKKCTLATTSAPPRRPDQVKRSSRREGDAGKRRLPPPGMDLEFIRIYSIRHDQPIRDDGRRIVAYGRRRGEGAGHRLMETAIRCIGFRVEKSAVTYTRVGLLSQVASVFDPLGKAAPLWCLTIECNLEVTGAL